MDTASLDARIGAICRGCGACCNWVLFRSASLEPAEVEWARRRRLPLVEDENKTCMSLPCAAHTAELTCSIYAERPLACREFECETIERLRDGETTLEEAERIVGELRETAARIERRLAVGRTAAEVARALADIGTKEERTPGSMDVDLLLDVGVLNALVRRHFVLKETKKDAPAAPAASPAPAGE